MHLVGKSILVTGADGFIGSHLVEALVARGCNVRAFVYYNSFGSCGWLDTIPQSVRDNIEILAGDVRDPYGVKHAMRGTQVVFHLAALIGIPFSYHAPNSYIDTNVAGTLNILQAARELNIEKLIQTSTSEVYGTARLVPINEEHPLQPQSPYAASKVAADQLALSFYRSFETPVAVVRPFNTYGPRQSTRAVIPTIITQVLKDNSQIKLGSVMPTRDFSYVDDTVEGFMKVAESDGSLGEIINIGSSFEISIGDTLDLITSLLGSGLRNETDTQRLRPEKSEVERLWADNNKARALTGWHPTYSGFEGFKRGLNKTIEWFKIPANLNHYKHTRYQI